MLNLTAFVSACRLATGELRPVQDMKAEDFMASAERNPTLKADPATVVRITSQRSHRVSIRLSVAGSEVSGLGRCLGWDRTFPEGGHRRRPFQGIRRPCRHYSTPAHRKEGTLSNETRLRPWLHWALGFPYSGRPLRPSRSPRNSA